MLFLACEGPQPSAQRGDEGFIARIMKVTLATSLPVALSAISTSYQTFSVFGLSVIFSMVVRPT